MSPSILKILIPLACLALTACGQDIPEDTENAIHAVIVQASPSPRECPAYARCVINTNAEGGI